MCGAFGGGNIYCSAESSDDRRYGNDDAKIQAVAYKQIAILYAEKNIQIAWFAAAKPAGALPRESKART